MSVPESKRQRDTPGSVREVVLSQSQYVPLPPGPFNETAAGFSFSMLLRILRRYWLLGIGLLVVGSMAGFISVVLTTPVYKATIILEIQGINQELMKTSYDSMGFDSSQTNIQTQITLLRSGPFIRRVFQRMQSESIPPLPMQSDLFSRLRRRVRSTGQEDPLAFMKEGLLTAATSFSARPINGTRLIELSCDATHPEIASNFVNTVANEYIEETARSRGIRSQRTTEWLLAQIEEMKANVKAAEDKLQAFVRSSGNMFAGSEGTVDDTKLKRLQLELAEAQAERIAKQARYEQVTKAPAEKIPELLQNEGIQSYAVQLAELRRARAALITTFTPNHYKVVQIQAQIDEIETTLKKETDAALTRIRNEYEGAVRREHLLKSTHAGQARQVTAQSDHAAQYTALRREVETLRQMYTSLLMQSNQASVSHSVPVSPVRLVEPSIPAQDPDRPRPALNIGLGCVLSLALSVAITYIREKSDRRVHSPDVVRNLMDLPQLGVIPSAQSVVLARRARSKLARLFNKNDASSEYSLDPSAEQPLPLTTWSETQSSALAESFRAVLASILSNVRHPVRMILVSSSGPGEGKTTVTANLGMALAEIGRSVVIADCDFRQPRLHLALQTENTWGITDVIDESTRVSNYSFKEARFATRVPGLYVLPAGTKSTIMPRALYWPRFNELLDRLRSEFDTILIDAPPILHFADARIIGRMADGVVLVIRSGLTSRDEALEGYQRLCEDGIVLLGTILNDWVPSKAQAQARRRYYYHYKSGGRA